MSIVVRQPATADGSQGDRRAPPTDNTADLARYVYRSGDGTHNNDEQEMSVFPLASQQQTPTMAEGGGTDSSRSPRSNVESKTAPTVLIASREGGAATATATAAAASSSSPVIGNRTTAKMLGEVVLVLRDIDKTFIIEDSSDPVIALRGINLCYPRKEGDDEPSEIAAESPLQQSAARGAASSSSFSATAAHHHHHHHHHRGGLIFNTQEQPPYNPLDSRAFLPIRRGEFVMIRGPSGGGKTTLLNIIGTLDAPTKGSVELLGRTIDKTSSDEDLAEVRLRYLGFVFQTFNLIATMTAAENVELPMTLAGNLTAKERRLRSRQLLALVGLRNRVDHLPSELSGGEQQRVTIARSLANNPSILLLDEPTGDLDTATTIDVMNLLIRLNHATKTTLIMVTHNPDLECYADRILYVADGRFSREVRNTEPKMLMLDQYVEYLNEREKRMTTETVHRER